MKEFITVSLPKKNLITIAITFAIMAALAFFGLTVTLAFWIFLEVLIIVSFIFVFLLVKKTFWVIELHDKTLFLYNNGNGQKYRLDELTYSSFILKQTEAQKTNNCGDVKFRDYPFLMYDVQNFKEFEAYIRDNL